MKDIRPEIAELLSDIAPVELAFPDCCGNVPLIALSDNDNTSAVILSGKDRYSRISIQTDIFADTPENAQTLAGRVNDVLTAKGIRRTFAQLFTDENRPRFCMRFTFGLDEVTGRVVSV